ncbi:MAG: MarR family transcriptional regulator [Alphaproteobacteria bacterium]|nr:MarR family transcriptional regulator [Alphaproteobacteria bacterium]MDE2110594.1 MarR family transcriptional regulator [Alphaproteobacteria bacterium]MDE2492678.1 MarR family transcriptional regulator [Alphaproteobacteria bacterium]
MVAFDNNLFFVLHDVARLLRTRFDQRARAYGMTRAQWVILVRLQRQPGLCQSDMASICEVEPITVARLVDRLEASGLVERRADPTDRRVHRLHLLPAAEPVLAEIARYRDQVCEELSEGLAPETWAAALDVLLNIKDKLTTDNKEKATAEGTKAHAGAGD